jgi:phage terminase large subunit-like protein
MVPRRCDSEHCTELVNGEAVLGVFLDRDCQVHGSGITRTARATGLR